MTAISGNHRQYTPGAFFRFAEKTCIGTAKAEGVTHRMLRDVSAHDPVAVVAVVLLLATTGLAACYFPARRATRIEPTAALRYE
jgi:ABC-type lipoprotein release transport system permease subunit